jgi:hypothetical protein
MSGKEDFKENDIVIYQNGSQYSIGKIKRLTDDGAFVWYHSGDTAAKTPYANLHKLDNAHCLLPSLGMWQMSPKMLANVVQYAYRLSRLVSPAAAKEYYNMLHDGSISDFLVALAVALDKNETLDLQDEFYGPVYGRICDNLKQEG